MSRLSRQNRRFRIAADIGYAARFPCEGSPLLWTLMGFPRSCDATCFGAASCPFCQCRSVTRIDLRIVDIEIDLLLRSFGSVRLGFDVDKPVGRPTLPRMYTAPIARPEPRVGPRGIQTPSRRQRQTLPFALSNTSGGLDRACRLPSLSDLLRVDLSAPNRKR